MAEIFVCPKGSISDRSVRALRESGVIVVQADDPNSCRFIRASEEISGHDMLWAAMKAICINSQYSSEGIKIVQQEFTKVIFGLVNDRRELAKAVDAVGQPTENPT